MLSVEDISVSYGKTATVTGVSLEIGKADKICLLGRNGVGKTTLLRSLIGLLSASKGSITFEGKVLTGTKPYQRSLTGLAYVPQGREIIPMLTVRENLELGAIAHHPKETERLIEDILTYFPALKEHMNRKGGVLSGGQQQQLAIGRALMSKPKILFLDEPSEGIQPNVVAEIATILNRVNKEKEIALFIVEQNLEFAFNICDRYFVMEKGSIVDSGSVENASTSKIRKYLTI
ncbi:MULTISPECIES: urea ABC transporter ATP-binding subunit UrtE [unclassified Paenibacillus]|uniref:urea ABC transporter ATP-binding subunit UrtE n=1 Tax=unclassified Paenibacillus TaxID=185978 RepID=UPI002405FA07|nr:MULTISPECIES: urea ABC transporter ATP-binding subunit UrtE [unclassified Paenibacillus]MDF9839777.1 urea transport system ATP-binding protein [Paenibacillus sp. PastF-2]MDF9846357.1 urea transport system ATP-binding protein [Paenibacillus sp. PastM-2]MDF9853293.1 urea transport system ATP-binding protein [Paenibacillus sp. PastF-1]MDH6478203.1 urea transport system ATP-binding protein [Paenibacillus sp. PastH-2]MDH6506298.1 urea transport system ATP-binding protein [Paenibacillus sp. PastM